ncbi:hypothetical protein B0H14DRAFT_2673333 [Mycena olivaceomarginata]|nr:hypothetical protein B0H14DRAFT_2673333 [Mycena olivaceomarginata]
MSSLRPPTTSYTDSDDVQTRLRAKPKFAFLHPKKSRTSSLPAPPNVSIAALPLAGPDPLIDIDPLSALSAVSDDQDSYRWAVVYENQRGLKIFSSLYYSYSSLLPIDPPPFTYATFLSQTIKEHGTWRWLSPWMIDMRSDSGEVQHDGFEYNFAFSTRFKWHPKANSMSWVRRRRWIRLMMRPAKSKDKKLTPDSLSPNTPVTPAQSILAPDVARNRFSVASSFPPSVLESHPEEDSSYLEINVDEVWQSDSLEANWERCRVAMRQAGRDGRILELWRRWLGYEPPEGDRRAKQRKQWTEDDDPAPLKDPVETPAPVPHTPPPIANIIPALRRHASIFGDAILHSYIYPESRARFIQMLERVGVLAELNAELGAVSSSSEVEFWSYLNEGGEKRTLAEDSTVKRK